MPIKVTMQMQLITARTPDAPEQRLAYWSESHWRNSEDMLAVSTGVEAGLINAAGGALPSLLTARALLLPDQAQLTGYRLQQYTVGAAGEQPIGSYDTFSSLRTNDKGANCDTPQHGCLCSAGLVTQPKRIRFTFRALPDLMTDGAALSFSKDYRTAVKQYLNVLGNGYGTIVDQRVGANFVPQPISSVDNLGVVQLENAPIGLVVGGLVNVTQTTTTAGRRVSGKYQIASVDAGLWTVTLLGWDKGPTKKGKLRVFERVFAAYNPLDIDYQRAVSHKVGSKRSYRGRNTRRR